MKTPLLLKEITKTISEKPKTIINLQEDAEWSTICAQTGRRVIINFDIKFGLNLVWEILKSSKG